jgi:hypothetical protein
MSSKKNEVGYQLAREQGDEYLLSDRTAHVVALLNLITV